MCDGVTFATDATLLFLLVSFHQLHLGLVAPAVRLGLVGQAVRLFYAIALMLKHSLPIQPMTRAIHY